MRAVGREIGIFDNAWQERPIDSAGRHVARRLRATKGELYVLVEIEEYEDEALEQEITRRVVECYYEDSARSVTTSLTHALSAVNEELYAANLGADPEDRCHAAVSCLALRGDEAYFAQVGSGLAYVVTPEAVRQLSTPVPPLSHLPTGLGSGPDIAVELFHQPLEGNFTVVLGAASLLEAAPPTSLRQVLVLDDHLDVGLALQALLRAAKSGAPRVVVVEVEGQSPRAFRQPVEEAESPPRDELTEQPDAPAGGEPYPGDETYLEDEAYVEDEPPVDDGLRLGDRVVRGLELVQEGIEHSLSSTPSLRKSLLVLAIVLLGLFAVVVVPARIILDKQEGMADESLIAQAEEKEREARAAADPAERLRLMVDASRLANQAAQRRRADPTAQAISRRLQAEVEALSGAVRLGSPTRLVGLDGQPRQIVLGGKDLYVLDEAVSRVYRYPLAPDGQAVQPTTSPAVFRRGERLGEVVSNPPGRLVWMPGGGAHPYDALLILDTAGALFEFEPSRGTKVLRSPALGGQRLLAGYAGSLFVLDPRSGALSWYLASPDGYGPEPIPYLQPDVQASFVDATTLAVDDDLYVLGPAGRVQRFAAGRPLPFDGATPGQPVGEGASLLATRRSVYVVDPGGRRLVQLDREGRYRRQLTFDAPDALVGLALDEARGLVYYLGERGVYLFRAELAQ